MKLAPHLREKMQIVTKCGIATTARAENTLGHYITDSDHIIASAEQSLKLLATDHIDLLLIHRPDPLMNADDVAEAFKKLHHSGKVRHFGVSNFTPAQFSLLQSRLPFTLATNQVEISPVHQLLLLDGTLDQLQQLRIRPMARSCLGGGRLFNDDEFQPLRNELAVIAQELNAQSIEQVVYAWILRLPSQPLPIIGSGKLSAFALLLSRIVDHVPPAMVPYPQSRSGVRRTVIAFSAFRRSTLRHWFTLISQTQRDGGRMKRLSIAIITLLACAGAQAASEQVEMNPVTSQGWGSRLVQ